jgi:DNA-binding Lrp family transcriptional regulator
MDEVDERIVTMMTEDARISFRKMAKELDKSPDTIINRYQRLRDAGDVRGSTIVVEPHDRLRGHGGLPQTSTSSGANGLHQHAKDTIKMPNIIVPQNGRHHTSRHGIHDFDRPWLGRIAALPGIKNIQTALWAGDEIPQILHNLADKGQRDSSNILISSDALFYSYIKIKRFIIGYLKS